MDTEILDLRELIVAVDQDVERAEKHPLQLHRGTSTSFSGFPQRFTKRDGRWKSHYSRKPMMPCSLRTARRILRASLLF